MASLMMHISCETIGNISIIFQYFGTDGDIKSLFNGVIQQSNILVAFLSIIQWNYDPDDLVSIFFKFGIGDFLGHSPIRNMGACSCSCDNIHTHHHHLLSLMSICSLHIVTDMFLRCHW